MDILSVLFSQQTRKIGGIIPSVAISEKHSDTLEITEHPIEDGAPVSDHAYKRPPEVTMELGFAGGGSLLDGVDTTQFIDINSGRTLSSGPREVYKQLLALQESRLPFDVTTGKRQYQNMLIRSLDVTTDRTSENVLMCVLTLRNVIISRTQSVSVADKANMMADGVSTSAVQNSGTKSAKPVNESLLSQAQRGALGVLGGFG
ncbi:TPA: phage baseplate protein [Serratia marcescens]